MKLEDTFLLTAYFKRVGRIDTFSFGLHYVEVTVDKNAYQSPRFTVWFVGDGLVYLHLVEKEASSWSGTFLSFPVSGL